MNISIQEYRQLVCIDTHSKDSHLNDKEKIMCNTSKVLGNEKKIDSESNKRLAVFCDPIGKPRMTQSDRWKHRKCVDVYFDYADKLRNEAEKQNFKLSDRFEVYFSIEMPKSWSQKKRDKMQNQPHQQKPDIDNLLKGVMDALKKDCDQSVFKVTASKWWNAFGGIQIENGGV